jgi:hypothetical protein
MQTKIKPGNLKISLERKSLNRKSKHKKSALIVEKYVEQINDGKKKTRNQSASKKCNLRNSDEILG